MTPAQRRIMEAVEAAPEGTAVCFDGRSGGAVHALYELGLIDRHIDHCQALREGGGLHRVTKIRVWLKDAPYPDRDEWPNGIPWWLA
jgi:hypothetical protein